MKPTNVKNLPQSIYTWLTKDEYKIGHVIDGKKVYGDISITGLLDSPRHAALMRKFAKDIVKDAESSYKVRRGTAIHDAIEKANKDDDDVIQECIFFIDVLGWKIKGQFDEYRKSTRTLTDFKTTAPFQIDFKRDETLEKWEQQLNIYAHMMRDSMPEHKVENLQVVAMLFDEPRKYRTHSKNSVLDDNELIKVYDIPLWTPNKAQAFLEKRVRMHQAARRALEGDGELMLCSDKDRWKSVKKKSKDVIEVKYIRCESWCDVANKCYQHNPQLKIQKEKAEQNKLPW